MGGNIIIKSTPNFTSVGVTATPLRTLNDNWGHVAHQIKGIFALYPTTILLFLISHAIGKLEPF